MAKRYAVLFKTHTWDAFDERQLRRLEPLCPGGDIFVFKDQTKAFHPVPPRYETLHASEAQCEGLRLQREPMGQVFWYCNDYPTYFLFEAHPEYDYYVVIEYDVGCCISIDALVAEVMTRGVDCVAQPVKTQVADWHWAATGKTVYAPHQPLFGALFCFAVFSRAAVNLLLQRRRALTVQFQKGEIKNWPYGELFMATELAHHGFNTRPLSEFANTDRYDWWPPSTERNLLAGAGDAVLHPVLDDARYIASNLKFTEDLHTYLDPRSLLRRQLDQCDRTQVMPPLFAELRRRRLSPLLHALKQAIPGEDRERLGAHANVALGKPATQSSTSPWSRRPTPHADATGGNDGKITGGYGFHTGEDEQPWWMVDLETPHAITEVRVYNRLDVRHRARNLMILTSLSGMNWSTLAQRMEDGDFGGADGKPFQVTLERPVVARFVRLQLPERALLHLDEIEVFGEPA